MKKILIVLAMLLFALPSFAYEIDTRKDGGAQKHVSEVGFKLLNANQIPYRMNFYVLRNNRVINAWSSFANRQVTITKEMFVYLQGDDELAAVLAHEISHGVDSNQGVLRGAFSYWGYAFTPRKYEYKDNNYYQNFLLTSRENRKKLEQKIKTKSTRKVNYL